MKKSLFLRVPLALAVLAAFAGCPQSADDDSNSLSRDPGAYEATVEDIAIAFADGADTVYLKDNLALGNGEVVIPAGKTLDLRQGVTINGITEGGKIVVAGDIEFPDNNNHDILLYRYPGHIITSQAFKDKSIDFSDPDGEGNFIPADSTKHVKAFTSQVITIKNFNPATEQGWIDYAADYGASPYIAIEYTGEIGAEGVKNINRYAYGKRLYIIGDIVLTDEIDLTKAPVGAESLYNVIADAPSSLLIGGKVVISGLKATVSTSGGFTVLGTLNTDGNRGDKNYVNNAGQLVAYYLDMVSGGSNFNGDVKLIGKFPSNFYTNADFKGDFEANGKVIFTKVSFASGTTVTFNGPVEFKGEAGDIKATGATVNVNGSISFLNEDPAINDTNWNLNNAELTYNAPYKGGSIHTFKSPVTFNSDFEFTGYTDVNGGTVMFQKDVTFNGGVKFSNATGSFGALDEAPTDYDPETKIIFAGETKLDGLFYGSSSAAEAWEHGFPGHVVFEKRPVFASYISFGTKAEFKSGLVLNGGGTFSGGEVLITGGEFTIPAPTGSISLADGVKIIYGVGENNITLTGISDSGDNTIKINDTDTAAKLQGGNTLSVTGGTLTVANVNIQLNGAGKVFIDSSAHADGGVGLALSPGTVSAASYTLDGTQGAGGSVALLKGSIGAITLTGKTIEGAGSAPRLIFAGTKGAVRPWIDMKIKDDLDITGVRIDLTDDNGVGTISLVAGAEAKGIVIKLSGSTATSTAGGIYAGSAGGTNGLVMGNWAGQGNATPSGEVNTGYIVTLPDGTSGGTFVAGTEAGTAVYKMVGTESEWSGSKSYIDTNSNPRIMLYGSMGGVIPAFIQSPVKVTGNSDVRGLVDGARASTDTDETMVSQYGFVLKDNASYVSGGSVAVFGEYVAPVTP